MNDQALAEPFARTLAAACPPSVVRAIENGGDPAPLFETIDQSGYLDALVSEADGGAGLSLAHACPLFALLGSHAVPLPVGETMIARALLAPAGREARGAIALVSATQRGQRWHARGVVHAATASALLVACGDRLALYRADDVSMSAPAAPWSLSRDLEGALDGGVTITNQPHTEVRALAALVRAAAIAGAGDRVLAMTAEHAMTRAQFGKPIARQQAIQQQLAVMAQHMVAARIAAQTGFSAGLAAPIATVATAKATTSRAATIIAEIAHAVHGAIGISADHDLHLFTRRLHEWRAADGAESYWEARLGALRLATNATSSVDFIRSRIAP